MRIARDKWLHLLVSAILTVIIAMIFAMFEKTADAAWFLGGAITFLLGLLKELYDKFCHREFSIDDIFADLAGILIGSGVYVVFALLFRLFKVQGW